MKIKRLNLSDFEQARLLFFGMRNAKRTGLLTEGETAQRFFATDWLWADGAARFAIEKTLEDRNTFKV